MSFTYFDSGLDFKLIVWEPLSAEVEAFVRKRAVAIPFTWLIETGVLNALHAKRFQTEIDERQLAESISLIEKLASS